MDRIVQKVFRGLIRCSTAPRNICQGYHYYIGAAKGNGESLFTVGWCLSCGQATNVNKIASKRYFKLLYEAGSGQGASFSGFA